MTLDPTWMNYISRMPLAIVLIAGIVYALITWNRHQTVSLLALLGSMVMLISQLGSPYLTTFLVERMHGQGMPVASIAEALTAVGIINSLLVSVGVSLLLAAAFGWRKSATPRL